MIDKTFAEDAFAAVIALLTAEQARTLDLATVRAVTAGMDNDAIVDLLVAFATTTGILHRAACARHGVDPAEALRLMGIANIDPDNPANHQPSREQQ